MKHESSRRNNLAIHLHNLVSNRLICVREDFLIRAPAPECRARMGELSHAVIFKKDGIGGNAARKLEEHGTKNRGPPCRRPSAS